MITNTHRRIADIAAKALTLGAHRRAAFLHALAKAHPFIIIGQAPPQIDPKKLRAARKRRRWSQTRLAKECGLSLRQVQNIEAGESGTTRKRTVVLYEIFGAELAAQ